LNVLLPKLLCLSLVVFTAACGRDPLQAGAHKGIRTIATSHTGPNSYHLQWIDLTDSPHAVLDKIEAGLGSNPGTKELLSSFYDLLGQVVPDQPTAKLRLAMHELLVRRGTEGTKRVFEIATELEKNFKGHPDQLYLSGYLRWVVIRAGNQINASALGQRARDDLRASWEKLLKEKPDYRGPQGVDAKWLKEQLRVLN
jgi:hypothetical protein